MKKILLCLFCSAALNTHLLAASFMGFELSPEVGLLAGKTQYSANDIKDSATNYGGFGRIWLGLFDFVVAPQIKFDFNESSAISDSSFRNFQYGLSAGYNIGLFVARLTPYVGINYSTFNKYFKSTTSYNAGLKFKLDFIPISLGVLYTYQNPQFEVSNQKVQMHSIQALIGLHF